VNHPLTFQIFGTPTLQKLAVRTFHRGAEDSVNTEHMQNDQLNDAADFAHIFSLQPMMIETFSN
jgi:hypothetical protein